VRLGNLKREDFFVLESSSSFSTSFSSSTSSFSSSSSSSTSSFSSYSYSDITGLVAL
jgi:hypothetical protein